MKHSRDQAQYIFKHGVNMAIENANQSGFVAAARFTFLADMMQIQCLYFENTNLLGFTLPAGLYSTVADLASHSNAKFSAYKTESEECFTLEFESEEDQDKFIQFFELMSFRGSRAYPTPDLYLGKSNIDKDFCREVLKFLHEAVQVQYEGGWNMVR